MNTATEHAFERRVEEILLRQGGWRRVANAEWEAERALFPARICAFLEATQPKLWAQMRALHADGLESLLVDALARELDLKGTLHVLRHGFKFYGKTFRMAWFKPAHALNEEVLALYGKNELTITRQAPCHPKKHDTVDLLFALNGLPVATCELKNPGTGQSWRHAVRQYRNDREDRKVFDCVVVITDRRVLDRQLQDAIYQIEHAQGVVKAIDRDSRQLAAALIDDTRIVVTTLQKFPFVLRGLLHAAGAESQEAATAGEKARAKAWEAEIAKRRYAVIVDEAHSSQSGETARELKAILGAGANLGVDEGLDPSTDLGAGGDADPSANEGAGKGLDPSTDGGVGPDMDLGADEGDGGHPFAAARGALQALLRALPGRERLYRRSSAGCVQWHGARPRHRHRTP